MCVNGNNVASAVVLGMLYGQLQHSLGDVNAYRCTFPQESAFSRIASRFNRVIFDVCSDGKVYFFIEFCHFQDTLY